MKKLLFELFLSLGGLAALIKLAISSEPSAIHQAFAWLLKIPAMQAFLKANASIIEDIIRIGAKATLEELEAAKTSEAPKPTEPAKPPEAGPSAA